MKWFFTWHQIRRAFRSELGVETRYGLNASTKNRARIEKTEANYLYLSVVDGVIDGRQCTRSRPAKSNAGSRRAAEYTLAGTY